ncbi:GPW/gp25 family protein [Gracilibacillus sp. YIM 98692]|uniref:GPW/gp25 family protein n=1 Tax=Gracilibacillus sp. YIM 98692 TaxID=2663532 RepID=UPI0013D1AAC3|nr:GPW/gp25 family protein [Gracilibacillus sp. YIM 98692]
MIDYQEVTIQNINFSAIGAQEIYENLRILYTTPEGSIPFDREFGINMAFLDQPTQIAQGRLIVEYTEKTKRFEPRAVVQEVLFDQDEQTGHLQPKVVIAIDLE